MTPATDIHRRSITIIKQYLQSRDRPKKTESQTGNKKAIAFFISYRERSPSSISEERAISLMMTGIQDLLECLNNGEKVECLQADSVIER